MTFDDGFVGPPAVFDVDEFRGARGGTADYGEHTDEILAELGYDAEQVLELRPPAPCGSGCRQAKWPRSPSLCRFARCGCISAQI